MFLLLSELFEFLNATPRSRNCVEGESVINAGHLVYCGKAAEDAEQYDLLAYCLQTSDLRGNPHEIKAVIHKKGQIISAECSCAAGLSEKCKHVAAVLLFCTRNDLTKIETISSTDKKCTWSNPRNSCLEQYQPKPLSSHDCFDIVQNRLQFSDDVRMAIREKLFSNNLKSALSQHVEGRHPCMEKTVEPPAPEHARRIQILIDQQSSSEVLLKLSNISHRPLRECCERVFERYTQEAYSICTESKEFFSIWKQQRQFRITGSRCYGLYTYKKNIRADWENKSSKYFYAPEVSNQYLRHGLKFESHARKLYEEIKSIKVFECGLIVSVENPWIGYSPDGIIFEEDIPVKLLEIKCPYAGKNQTIDEVAKTLSYLQVDKENNTILKTKHTYYAQIQFGMAILNLKQTDFVLYAPHDNSIKIIPVQFDQKFAEDLFSSLKVSFFDHMLHFLCTSEQST